MRGICVVMVAWLLVGWTGVDVAGAEDAAKTLSPYFFVESGDTGAEHFPLKSTSVNAEITGMIADVRVTQAYANMGADPINARYIFPASTRAAVHGMRMTVGEDVVTAQIQAREEARETFHQAKAAGQSASLLEQQRPNVFSMQVANIMPGETVVITLHYSELLVAEAGVYRFVFPTVVGPRYAAAMESEADDGRQWVHNPYLPSGRKAADRFDLRVDLATGLPIQEVACATHMTDVDWHDEAHALVTLAENETGGGDRDFILEYRLSGETIHSGLMLAKGEKENFFLLMVQPPRRVNPEQVPPREYIFVVDVSGSMHGFPLDTAKALLRELIGGLRDQDRFNVILFSGGARLLAPQSLPADARHIAAALDLIDRQGGGGGTELKRALEKALALPQTDDTARTLVVVTDGYIAAERPVFRLIAGNLNRANLFAFGIGSSVNRYLIEGLARAGQGEPFVVTEAEAAPSAARRFQAYVRAPLLAHVAVDFGAFDAYDLEPEISADLFAQRPLIICGKWRGRPEGEIRVSGHTGKGLYERRFVVSPRMLAREDRALPLLWARSRLSRISDFASSEDEDATREQVTRLGLGYHLLTAYTSFVAVHETVRNTGAPAQDVDHPLPLPLGVSNLAVGGRRVPEPGLGVLGVLLIGFGMLLRRRRWSSGRRSFRSHPGDCPCR